MSWALDYRIRTGVEYTPPIYLPRLQGADAIPKLTHTKFRSSCSPNCIHSWRPRPPPPTPPPPPINPMNVYRLMLMRNKLYGLEDNGSFRIEPDDKVTETKYDSIMRNVVLNLKPKKIISRKQSKLGYRASTSQMIQSNRVSSLKRTKSEIVSRRSKLTKIRKSFKRHPCWHEEIERLEHSSSNLIKFTTRFERDYWRSVDDKYDQLVELDKSKKKLVNAFPETLAAHYSKIIAHASQREAKEDILREQLKSIESENEHLEEAILLMQQYERIGGQRDEIEIARLISEINLQDSTTKKELDNKPFVAPEIIKPSFAPLAPPPVTTLLHEKVAKGKECVDLLIDKINQLKAERKKLKTEQKNVRIAFDNLPAKTFDQSDDEEIIPKLNIPLRKNLQF